METIKIKYFKDKLEKLTYIDGKSDWIDLRAAEDVDLKQGEFKLIPLGVAMQLPKGYEAHIVPRSSTFKNFGIIQTNHPGFRQRFKSFTCRFWLSGIRIFPLMTGSASSVSWRTSRR